MDDFYKNKGYVESSLKHGNSDLLPAFFDQIYQQQILDPEYKEQPNPIMNQHEQEKISYQQRIEDLKNKILDVKNDEEKFRKEKKEYEELARKYDLENHSVKFNPGTYQTLRIIGYLLIVVIIIVYSIFFMHLFSKPTAKIWPPFNELVDLFSNYWLACLLTIIPIALGYTIDQIFRAKTKFRQIILTSLIGLSLFLDYIIASATRSRIIQANEILGLPSPSLLEDTNFWIVLLIGPLPIYILSIILNFKHKKSKEYIEEQSRNPYSQIIKELRDKELNRKYKVEELSKDLEKLQSEYNRLLNIKDKIQYIPKEELDTRIFNFYDGWINWITNFYNQLYEQNYGVTKSELLSRCKQEYEKFKQESQKRFTTIYPTF